MSDPAAPQGEDPRVERIVAAAIKVGPCIYTGPHHASIIRYVAACTGVTPVIGPQGFMTNTGRFVDRAEARGIAVSAGQLDRSYRDRDLFSEFLWIVPDAERENAKLREALEKIGGVEKGMGTHRPCCARGAELARAALDPSSGTR